MEREDAANGDMESWPPASNVSPKPTLPGHFSAPSIKSITDRKLNSRRLSFKLRRGQSKDSFKMQNQPPKYLSGQQPWEITAQITGSEYQDSKADVAKTEMFPSIGPSAVRGQSPSRLPSTSPLATLMDMDSLSDIVANDATCHKAAMDAVQYKNVGGIFVHIDKYAAGRFAKHFNHSPTPSGETILITPDGFNHRADQTNKKARHVAWEVKGDSDDTGHEGQGRKVHSVTPAIHSVRSDSSCLNKPRFISNKNKVDHVNVNWKMSQGQSRTSDVNKHERRTGRLSKNVLPVTIGVDHRGTSVSKTKWLVPTLSSHDASQVWFKCLNFVKQRTAIW